MSLELLTSAADFLAAARDHLAAEPVLSTVVSTYAERRVVEEADGFAPRPEDWWLVVRDDTGEVVGAGMRTAPFAPRPAFLLAMPDEAAVALARVLHDRGEALPAVNGALPAVRVCADETVRLGGGAVSVGQHTRLFELGDLVAPRTPPGHLRAAEAADLPLVSEWFGAFLRDADEQAGRRPGASAHEPPPDDELLRRLEGRRVWLWVDEDGDVVHLTGANAPSLGVARVGPVYTPPEARGRGFASAAVAAVSSDLRARGARVCLFTDQANPTSNRIYEALGFRPVVDMANLVVTPG